MQRAQAKFVVGTQRLFCWVCKLTAVASWISKCRHDHSWHWDSVHGSLWLHSWTSSGCECQVRYTEAVVVHSSLNGEIFLLPNLSSWSWKGWSEKWSDMLVSHLSHVVLHLVYIRSITTNIFCFDGTDCSCQKAENDTLKWNPVLWEILLRTIFAALARMAASPSWSQFIASLNICCIPSGKWEQCVFHHFVPGLEGSTAGAFPWTGSCLLFSFEYQVSEDAFHTTFEDRQGWS